MQQSEIVRLGPLSPSLSSAELLGSPRSRPSQLGFEATRKAEKFRVIQQQYAVPS